MNNQLARRFSFLAFTALSLSSILPFGTGNLMLARPQALEECVERLARRTAAMPHEHRMSLVWTNRAALSEQRAERLRLLFAQRLEAAQVHLLQGEAAPQLRVSIEQTPSQIVFTALVPAEGSVNVLIEDVERRFVGSDERPSNVVRLEKELLWQQETRVLSAVLPRPLSDERKRMILLSEDSISIYSEEQGSWKLQATKPLPGPRQLSRGARGQLLLAEENVERAGILLPGRRCETSLVDDSPVVCAGGSGSDWPVGRLLSLPACGAQAWWLKSDGRDWTVEDRLLLRSSGPAKETAPLAEWTVPGAVFSIGAGPDARSAAVVLRSLTSGDYEVYRVALACTN